MLTTWSQMQIVHKATVVNTFSSCFVYSFILCLISPSLCVWQGGEKGEGQREGRITLDVGSHLPSCWRLSLTCYFQLGVQAQATFEPLRILPSTSRCPVWILGLQTWVLLYLSLCGFWGSQIRTSGPKASDLLTEPYAQLLFILHAK